MARIRAQIALFAILLIAAFVADASGQIRHPGLARVGSGVVNVESGNLGTVLFRMSNPGGEAARVQLILDLPDGWLPLLAPTAVDLDPESSASQLITFGVPGHTPAGDYSVRVYLDDGTTSAQRSSTIEVTVLARFGIAIDVLEKPSIVAAGDAYHALYRIENTGNAEISLSLSLSSSLRYPVSLDEDTITLQPGERRQVPVGVQTSDKLTNRLIHQTRLRAESPVLAEAVTGIAGVDLVPRSANLVPEARTGIPILISASGYSEGGVTGRQLEAEIRTTRIGDKTIDLLIRAPDIRATSSYGRRDVYSLGVDAPNWTLRLGDHSYPLTDLTETGSAGFGGSFSRKFGPLELGGHANSSRHVFPKEKQFAGFARMSVSRMFQAGISYLGRREFEEGDIVSISTRLAPLDGTTLDSEYARGWSGGESDDALSVRLLSQSRTMSFSARFLSAGDRFLGAVKNITSGTASMNLAPADWLRIQGQYRMDRRYYRVDDLGRASQDRIYYRAGAGITHSLDGRRLWIMTFMRKRVQDSPLFDFRRQEHALEVVAGYNVRRLGITLEYHRGRAEDPSIENGQGFWKAALSLFGSVRRVSFSANSEYTFGPTFYNPVPQERLSAGVSLAVEVLKGLKTSVNTQISRDRLFSDQTFQLLDARIDYRFPFGHELELQARITGTGADRDIRASTFSVSYSVPLSLNLFSVSSTDVLSGKVYDLETGAGVADAVISLGRTTVLSDANGQFRLPRPVTGTEYLSIDRNSIGLDRVTVQEMPMPIIAGDPTLISLEIAVTRSSVVQAGVTYDLSDEVDRSIALTDALSPGGQAGVVVELTNGLQRHRRVTDHEGGASFPDLVPGVWYAFVVDRSVSEGYRADPDTVQFTIAPGQDLSIPFSIKPRRRAIQILNTGIPSLSRGGSAIPPNAVLSPPVPVGDEDIAATERKPEPTVRDSTSIADVVIAADSPDQQHIVVPGETLARIARRYYDQTNHWIRIWLRNRDTVPDPHLLQPDLLLHIPPAGPLTSAERSALVDIRR